MSERARRTAIDALAGWVRARGGADSRAAVAWLAAWQHGGEAALAIARAQDDLAQDADILAGAVRAVPRDGSLDAVDRAHEMLLAALDGAARTRRGAYFTPAPLAAFVAREAQRVTREERWAGARCVIDPAAGAGIFVDAALRLFPVEDSRFVAHEIDDGTCAVLRARFANDPVGVHTTDSLGDAVSWSREDETLVVVGNPPFSGRSASSATLAADLLRGKSPGGATESYYHVDGIPLAERNPKWLQDDCVKFIRVAQWQLERAARGVVALVCTQAFVHQPTFRAMRHSLARAHDGVRVVDLHGNTKKLEVAPLGTARDENVFAIQQGVCVLVFWRGDARAKKRGVWFAEMWGSRDDKLARFANDEVTWREVHPVSPRFDFAPDDDPHATEYLRGFALDTIFERFSPAVVTGRDSLLVAPDAATLAIRVREMRDRTLDEVAFRDRYLRARDRLDVQAAREATHANGDPFAAITPCLYRPFDHRVYLDLDPWIERARRGVMSALIDRAPDQIALVARRQSPPSRTAPFVFASREPVIDGAIRSDNHGSESVFPLWMRDARGERVSNLAPAFVAAVRARIGEAPAPFDLVAYIYALLHAPSYRVRYAAALRREFPRIACPPTRAFFVSLARHGRRLFALHTDPAAAPSIEGLVLPAAPFAVSAPSFADHTVSSAFSPVTERAWQFEVGGYRPLHKWLADRVGTNLDAQGIAHYARIIGAVESTLAAMDDIDAAIRDAGGLPFE